MMNLLAYIDPGTGSMLLTVILGVVAALVFALRGFFINLKVRLQGGKIAGDDEKTPVVIFSDHKRYWNVFEGICDELEKRKVQCHYMTCSPDDPALSKPYQYINTEFIGEGNKGFARLNLMKAGICLATTPGLDVLQWKRSKDVDWYAHIYHAVDDSRGYRMFALDYYDAVLATGPVQIPTIRQLEQMRGTKEKEIVTVGCMPLDVMLEKAAHFKPANKERRTVLLAPSWGPSSILNRFGETIIDSLLATGYKIIIRPHPQSKLSEKEMLDRLMGKYPESDSLSWNFDNDNFNVLSESDIMISDYSGVMFDYSFIFDRPFIYADTSFDKAPYEAAWFDDEPWLFRMLPKLGVKLEEKDFGNLKEIIDRTIESEEFKKNLEQVKKEGWTNRGHAAEKTADYLQDKLKELKKKEEALKAEKQELLDKKNKKGTKKLKRKAK